MPRPSGARVTSSVLDLGNYSTMVIDLPSADSTVLLKVNKIILKSCLSGNYCEHVFVVLKDGTFCGSFTLQSVPRL